MWAWLRHWWRGPDTGDGFGQSLLDDIRFFRRFKACARRSVTWREPSAAERAWIDGHPIVGRFGDATIGVADVEGRRWIVRDRDWHGWPDPPQFVVFALEGDTIWAAADFDAWPACWRTIGKDPNDRSLP